MHHPTPPIRISVAIRRPDDDRILVLAGGTLPTFELPVASPWPVVTPVNEAMAGSGLPVTTLRAAWLDEPEHASPGRRLYECVLVDGRAAQRDGPPGRWLPVQDLAAALEAEDPVLVAAVAAGALAPSDGVLQPWYAPGWIEDMTTWVDDRLIDAGLRRQGAIRQIRSWARSALLQVETDRGLVWAKAVPEAFAHEIAVTELLADVDPGLVPPVIATDVAEGRLLLAHVAGPLLADVAEPGAWIATAARLGEVQRVLAQERPRLGVAGVAAAPIERLTGAVASLIGDRRLARVGRSNGLDERAARHLASQVGRLVDACERLAAIGLPDSLDHGDLAPSQVILGEMGPVIFDWSDASVTNPFLTLASFLSVAPDVPVETVSALTEAYQQGWGAVLGPSDAAEAGRLATLVAPLHLAQLYRDRILPALAQPWEVEHVVPAALRALSINLATRPSR